MNVLFIRLTSADSGFFSPVFFLFLSALSWIEYFIININYSAKEAFILRYYSFTHFCWVPFLLCFVSGIHIEL